MNRIYTCIMEESGQIFVKDLLMTPDTKTAIEEAERATGKRVLALVPGKHAENSLIRSIKPYVETAERSSWGQMPENCPPGF